MVVPHPAMIYPKFNLKAIGTLAVNPPKANNILSGLLVSKDYSYTLIDPKDLHDFAGLSTCVVTQRQHIALNVGWELVRWHLEGMYGSVEDGYDEEGLHIMKVRIFYPRHEVSLISE